MVLEKSLESPLTCKETKSVNCKGNQSWLFTGRTDAKAETLILWPPDAKGRLIRKDPDAGIDWRREEKGTKDEIVGWHHQLNGLGFEQILGDGEGQAWHAAVYGSQRVRHSWATEQQQLILPECIWIYSTNLCCCYLVAKLCLTLLRPCGLYATRLLCQWAYPGNNTGVGCHFLFQGIFPLQGSNSCHLHWLAGSLPLSHQGNVC